MADTKTIMTDVEGRMQRAIDHLEEELNNVRAGKASPNVLNGVMVDYYGSMTPVSGVASVTVPDAKTILIQPWDKKMIKPIEKAIIDSNIGLTPSNNGEQILLSIPPLTEERRKLLVKQIRQEAEQHAERDRDRLSAFRRLQKRPCVSGHRGEQNQGENPGTHRNSGTVRRQKHRQKSLPDIAQDAEQSNPRSGH